MAGSLKAILILILLASPALAKDVDLEWDHDCVNATGFHVYRSQGSSHWPELVGSVDCPTTEFTDLDVPYGELSWVVTAYGTEESNASNEVELAYYYALVRFYYNATSGRLEYKGENASITATDAQTDWVITKFYYNAQGMVTEMRVRTTSWDARATGW